MTNGFIKSVYRPIVLILGLWLFFDLAAQLIADSLWFQEVGYLSVFWLRLKTQLGLWVITGSLSAGFLLGNLALANQLRYPTATDEPIEASLASIPGQRRASLEATRTAEIYPLTKPIPQNAVLNLRWLLPIVLGLGLLIGLMLLHYGQVAWGYWHPDLTLPNVTPLIPVPFQLISQVKQLTQSPEQVWQLGILLGVLVTLLLHPLLGLIAFSVLMSLGLSLVLSGQWTKILQAFHPTLFNRIDPLYGQDISFYVFQLPIWELLNFWLSGLCFFGFVAVVLVYLLSEDSLSQGRFSGFSPAQLRHVYGLGSCMMLVVTLHYWLLRHKLLYSINGVAYGASYTDVTVQLPINTTLAILSLVIALFLLWQTIFASKQGKGRSKKVIIVLLIFCLLPLSADILAAAVQLSVVQPNELAREKPYIERSIAFSRAAFDLDSIEVQTFDPKGQLTSADLEKNDLTIRNIRLWDTRPLLETNRQLQQIRLYYNFPDADIDRYTLKTDQGAENQQVIIAARELDYSAVPEQAKTWVNKHLIYTHGYGFTLSPVNKVAPGGLPDYFVKNIGTASAEDEDNSALGTSSEGIRVSIPIGKPRIYYGELTNTYVMTPTKAQEFDYPSGDDNVYNTYDGKGGVAIGSFWRRCLFAQYLKDWQMLFTRNFTPQTRLLFRRTIQERVRAIAPFLRFDSNPYLVVANTEEAGIQNSRGEVFLPGTKNQSKIQNNLYWIIDAYTTSDRYPYSDPGKEEFNYIRNSVKVIVDAYNGDVAFYIADPKDPIIQSWAAIFPDLLKSLDTMPASLRSHLRYPVDLFSIQSERLLTYHMTDAQVFYNREDQWQVPSEIYGSELRPVEPYYLIMKLPTAEAEEFILLLPFTPTQRTNLIAWLAARSDGKEFGKLLLYQFPKQQLVYGTEQIEALINQDPVISQQISLWNRQGSRALQGNLLVIPIERSLLYVEPLYLEAEQNSLPTLVRVIVVYENRIVMAETLEQALEGIFQVAKPTSPAIVRPVGSENVSP